MNDGRRIRVEYSTRYIRSFRKLPHGVQEKARRREEIFSTDPFDVRLETHKLHGKFQNYWAYSVDRKCRVIFRFIGKSGALFLDVGTHSIYE